PQDDLPGLLLDLAELDQRDFGNVVPRLLRELAQGDRLALLALLDLALGDRPVAQVLLDPVRSAHVRKEHLQRALALAPEEDPGARPSRFVAGHPASRARFILRRAGAFEPRRRTPRNAGRRS